MPTVPEGGPRATNGATIEPGRKIELREPQLFAILDTLPLAVMLRAPDGTLLHLNAGGHAFIERLGVGIEAISPSPSSLVDHVEVIDEHGRPHVQAHLPVVAAIREGASKEATLGYALPGGGYAWYSTRAVPVSLSDGTIGTIVTVDDVTERHEAQQRVAIAERSLRLTFDHAPIGIAVIAPGGAVLEANAALCELLGSDEATIVADGLASFADPDAPDDEAEQIATWVTAAEDRDPVERHLRHASGRTLISQISVAVVPDDDGTPLHLILQVVDVSEQRALELELRTAAVEDPLTGLANRRALSEQLAWAQKRQRRDAGHIVLLYLDLDEFKQVNDRFGHEVGDQILIETGQLLSSRARATDIVCRMGGDEFVVLCAPIATNEDVDALVQRFLSIPPVSVRAEGGEVTVSSSIGSIVVDPDERPDQALRRADAAMYRAKGQRGDSPASHLVSSVGAG